MNSDSGCPPQVLLGGRCASQVLTHRVGGGVALSPIFRVGYGGADISQHQSLPLLVATRQIPEGAGGRMGDGDRGRPRAAKRAGEGLWFSGSRGA